MFDRDPCSQMGFHVDRNRTGPFMKPSLGVGAHNGHV